MRFVGERDSLITKCPSKYTAAPPSEKQNSECSAVTSGHEPPRAGVGADGRPGRACLLLALAVCVYGIGASLYGVRSGRPDWSTPAGARSTRWR